MADNTLIEWADATVNAVNGCSVVSPGCTNCYAMKLAGTRLRHHPSRAGLTDQTKAGPVWNGQVRLNEDQLLQPLRWKRPRRIFWNAHGDLFHDAVPDEWIDRVFAVCALTPHHQHLILTKRSARMREYVNNPPPCEYPEVRIPLAIAKERLGYTGLEGYTRWPLPNVWLGVSVEDQARADQRIPDLLATPAAVRFISAEPLLGPVDLCWIATASDGYPLRLDAMTGIIRHTAHKAFIDREAKPDPVGTIDGFRPKLDWVIVGGESGPGARPMHPDWARSLRDQCQAAGVPFFFKQWGEFAPGEIAGDYLDPERRAKGFELFGGRWQECWSEVDGHCDDEPDVYRVGKAKAGRLLDGREWSEVPA